MDRETVMRGLECCCTHIVGMSCGNCPYEIEQREGDGISDCTSVLAYDALALLKEQEKATVHDPGAYCPKCGWMLYPEDHPHNCGNCGQAVKWE